MVICQEDPRLRLSLMHKMFGSSDKCCNECNHYFVDWNRKEKYCKCKVYGMTDGEESDWSGTYEGCGMMNREWTEKPVISMTREETLSCQRKFWEDKR